MNKARKLDLLTLYDDLIVVVSQNLKIADLIKLISKSEDYNEDFVKVRLKVIVAERIEKYELKKSEFQNKLKVSDDSSAYSQNKICNIINN